jgi:excisionase family DNA binding protein
VSRRRTIAGELLDVTEAARFLGFTEKALRARVERRVIPFRRLGGRICFLKGELERFLAALEGCDADEALANLAHRREHGS